MLNGMKATNTQTLFKTVACEHLDVLVYWATGEFPDSGLLLVRCQDERWFVEVEYGQAFDGVPGLSFPFALPYTFPDLFASEELARGHAIVLLKAKYPSFGERDLSRFNA